MLISRAVDAGNLELVKKLLDEGADIHAGNDYALRWASWYGYLEMVKLLLNRGAGNNGAIHWASSSGHPEVVELLKNYKIREKYYRRWRRFAMSRWAGRLLQVWYRPDMPGGQRAKRSIAEI